MRHCPANVVSFTFSEVITNKEVAKVEDEGDDDTGEGTTSHLEDDIGGHDGVQTVADVRPDDEPSRQHPRDYQVQMLNCAGLTGNVFSVEKHHWVAKQLTKEQPSNKITITITISFENSKCVYLRAASEPPAASAIDLIKDILRSGTEILYKLQFSLSRNHLNWLKTSQIFFCNKIS